MFFSLTNKIGFINKSEMITDIVLTDNNLTDLHNRFEVTSNEDFLKFFTAFVNERRLKAKADLMITNPTSPLMKVLSKEYNPNISSVKNFAKRHGWKKTAEFLSSLNSEKARRKVDVELSKRAESISNPTRWFRSMHIGDFKVGKFESAGKCKSVSSMLARWNHTEGVGSGIFISARYYWDLQIVTIKAMRRKV